MKRTRPRRGNLRRHARRGYGKVWRWVMERANWRCEVVLDGQACGRLATQVHHILPRGRGGADDLGNLLAVCAPHHYWIHDHPADAKMRGYLRSSWDKVS